MKSFNVDDKLIGRKLIKQAIVKVCKGKKKKKRGLNRKYKQAQRILAQVDKYTGLTYRIILATEAVMRHEMYGTPLGEEDLRLCFRPKKCQSFTITDGLSGKSREITSSPLYPDQVIQQVLIEAAQPVFMREMYTYSCGSIPKRGMHKGQKYIKKIINRHSRYDRTEIKYGAVLDITKCYPSFSHKYLKERLKRKFRGRLFLYIMFMIIDSYDSKVIDGEAYGIPIGYLTSPWLCNFGFTPLDHYIKERLHIRYYLRNTDDMILFGRNKKALHKSVTAISEFLVGTGCHIKHTWQVFRCDYMDKAGNRKGRVFDTLGLRFFRDKTILRKRNALKIRRQAVRISEMKVISVDIARSFMSRIGQLKHCNSYNFYMKYVKPFVKIKKLKKVISNADREQHKANRAV